MVLGMKQQRSPNTYTPKERNLYLTGLLGQNMIYNIIGTGLVFYFQSVLFIPAMATGVIFAVARVWDAINDPMMGTIVDRTNTKWGKSHFCACGGMRDYDPLLLQRNLWFAE